MSAPWKPKYDFKQIIQGLLIVTFLLFRFMTDGYEINYNNDVQRRWFNFKRIVPLIFILTIEEKIC